ncbi:UNVERIFIED_CONTAM: hypothetical protein GTU68_022847 [Idotea baltica]|nr:hypothetical protein [Idotea baltica]
MIELKQLQLQRGNLSLDGLNLAIPKGEYAILVGPSGSGKSSILEALVGLIPASGGHVILNETDVTSLHPADRNVAYVPQDLALFSSMSVAKNISFGLGLQRVPTDEIHARVSEIAKALQLTSVLHRKADQLSRGQAQRVAIGRAIVMRPSLLIMDEPLNSLDVKVKSAVVECLRMLHQQARPTVLHVTHQPDDLAELASFRCRLEAGKLFCD